MAQEFKKIEVPGPESEEEVKSEAVDSMLGEWYKEDDREDLGTLDKHSSWTSVLVMFIIFIFVLVGGVFVVNWVIGGYNPLDGDGGAVETPDIVTLTIRTPKMVDSGDEVTFSIVLGNTGNATLTDVNLNLFYPDNFIFNVSNEQPVNADQNFWKLPALEPNTTRRIEVTGHVVGRREEIKRIKAALTYKPTNFHSTFKEETEITFTIRESALDIALDAPENLLPTQEVVYTLTVTSTSKAPQENVFARFSLPKNFQVTGVSQEVIDDVWQIGTMEPESERVVEITGTFDAKPGELKEMIASVGFQNEGKFLLQNQVVHISSVVDPAIELTVTQFEHTKLTFGEPLQAKIQVNNLSTLRLEDAVLELTITESQEDLLKMKTLNIPGNHPYEIISEGSGVEEGERKIRFTQLDNFDIGGEITINFSIDVIEVPFDIGASEFFVSITPAFRATSDDLSVPVIIEGTEKVFTVERL